MIGLTMLNFSLHLILTRWPIMQKVHFNIYIQVAYKITISKSFSHDTLHYYLCIIFSLKGRYLFIKTSLIILFLGLSVFN
jgi:hypothetical protein